jgi:hypothetical protein
MNKFFKHRTVRSWNLLPVAAAFSFAITSPAAESKAAPKGPKAAKEKVVVSAPTGDAAVAAPKSTFRIDKNFRDPFFPKASNNSKAVAATATAAATPADVQSALRSGFQGVMGAGERRLAMINNVILEPGRNIVVPVKVGAFQQKVAVHVVDVLRNGVVLEVQGQKQPLTITYAESR